MSRRRGSGRDCIGRRDRMRCYSARACRPKANNTASVGMITRILASALGKRGRSAGESMKVKQLGVTAPTHRSADLTRRQKRPLPSRVRDAATPMPIAPTVAPVDAVPAPTAALSHKFDRRRGAEFNRSRLGGAQRLGFHTGWVDSGHSGWRKNSGVGKAGGDKENLIGIMMSQVPLANGSPYRR
jgi:hypothetical protein